MPRIDPQRERALRDRVAWIREKRLRLAPEEPIDMGWLMELGLSQIAPDWEALPVDEIATDRDTAKPGRLLAHGAYLPRNCEIWLQAAVWDGLAEGDPDMNLVAAHEIGHLIAKHEETRFDFIDSVLDPYSAEEKAALEVEAGICAAELLAPWRGVAAIEEDREAASHVRAPLSVVEAQRFWALVVSRKRH